MAIPDNSPTPPANAFDSWADGIEWGDAHPSGINTEKRRIIRGTDEEQLELFGSSER